MSSEDLRIKEAFEYFISLGGKPTDNIVREVSGKIGVSERTIWRWYKKYNWKEQAIIRNQEIAKKLQKATDTDIVSEKAKFVKQVQDNIKILQNLAVSTLERDVDGKLHLKFNINSAEELQKVLTTQEKQIRLLMDLLGDNVSSDSIVQVIVASEDSKVETEKILNGEKT